jgi:hypothetical protein
MGPQLGPARSATTSLTLAQLALSRWSTGSQTLADMLFATRGLLDLSIGCEVAECRKSRTHGGYDLVDIRGLLAALSCALVCPRNLTIDRFHRCPF